MEQIISTPRLRLILVTKADKGSPELAWLHEICSNEQATWWSITGRTKSLEETEKASKRFLPTTNQEKEEESESETEEKTYRVVYTVHIPHHNPSSVAAQSESQSLESDQMMSTEFIGLVTLKSTDPSSLALPEHLTIPANTTTPTLTVDLAYMFLPAAWGQGYATETLNALFEGCRRAPSFWTPYSKVYMRAIVNEENPASMRVIGKTGMTEKGVYEWTGQRVFLAGKWVERSRLRIYGMHLVG